MCSILARLGAAWSGLEGGALHPASNSSGAITERTSNGGMDRKATNREKVYLRGQDENTMTPRRGQGLQDAPAPRAARSRRIYNRHNSDVFSRIWSIGVAKT